MSNFKLDWLGFTFLPNKDNFPLFYKFKLNESPDQLLDAFYSTFPELLDFVMSPDNYDMISYRPGNHYSCMIDCCDYFWISFDSTRGALNKGVNVQIPSHGLFKFFEIMGFDFNRDNSIYALFKTLFHRCCSASRIDLCFDDYSKRFRPLDYYRWYEIDHILSCNFRCVSFHKSSNGAQTTYFGKERSDKFLRIYDKWLQSNGEIDSVRYEFELHGKPCKELFLYMVNEENFDFGKYLLSWFKVLDPERIYDDTNRGKSPLLPEWELWLKKEFSEVPTPIKIPKPIEDKNQFSRQRWVQACKWAIFTAQTCAGVDPLHAAEFLGIDPQKDFKDIPIKYKRCLIDMHIDLVY